MQLPQPSHPRSATFAICWRLNLPVVSAVWYCQGSTTATQCSTAFHAATSRSYSVFRTVQDGSFFRRHGDHTPSHYYTSCTGCRLNVKSGTSWQYWWRTRSEPCQHQRIRVVTSSYVSDMRTLRCMGHDHSIVWTVRQYTAFAKRAFRCSAPVKSPYAIIAESPFYWEWDTLDCNHVVRHK